MIEIIKNNNGPHLFYTQDSPEKSFAALNSMQFGFANDGYPQYCGEERRKLIATIDSDVRTMKVIKI